jgi:predicted outer membrane repeat protein
MYLTDNYVKHVLMRLIRIICLFVCLSTFAVATVWHVPDSLSTIQEAVETALSGDTVMVKNPHQNKGAVEIIGKKIALLSSSYINNPTAYNIAAGAALFDSTNSAPLLKISNADSSVVRGFLLDQSDMGNGGGVLIENSQGVVIDGVFFKGNSLKINNSNVDMTATQHYAFYSNDSVLISLINSNLILRNSIWKNSDVATLLKVDQNSDLSVDNLAVFNNTCSSYLYDIRSSFSYFNFFTSYWNTCSLPTWNFQTAYVQISNSVLEFSPPVDISQCDITYSSVPGNYPGIKNLSIDPRIDLTKTYPALSPFSPCISAANPDTSGIMRYDLLGRARPNPEWAPPDMGAFESERYMLLNDDSRFWVSLEGHDIWGNGSRDYPFASLQAAANYANDADTLILLPGTYRESLLLDDKSLTISSQYILNNDSAYMDSIVLLPIDTVDAPLILCRNVDSLKVLGITLRGGRGYKFYNNYSFGGAIYCENSYCYVENVLFENNQAEFSGGALFASNSTIELKHVKLKNNKAYLGGAISLSSSMAFFSHVNIEENFASSGAGIHAEVNSKLTAFYTNIVNNIANTDSFENNLNKPNLVSQYGGAFYGTSSQARFHNSLFANNVAVNKGGAIAMRGGQLTLVQSTLADNNTVSDLSSVVFLKDLTEPALFLNSIFWNPDESEVEINNSDIGIYYSDLEGGTAAIIKELDLEDITAQNNLNINPLFTSEYSLQSGSPCLNVATRVYIMDDVYLINYANTEYAGSAPDMGHVGAFPAVNYEFEPVATSVDALPNDFIILNAFPNPFNPNTVLHFNLIRDGKTEIHLYNIKGQLVQTFFQSTLRSGDYKLNINASSLPTGVYVCQLMQNGISLASHKLLLVK